MQRVPMYPVVSVMAVRKEEEEDDEMKSFVGKLACKFENGMNPSDAVSHS